MTSPLLGLATAIVRAWTRLYTWRMPPALREARRAEIESDLWEFEEDSAEGRGLMPAAHAVARLLIGMPDDLGWRLEQAALRNNASRKTVAWTATVAGGALLLAALWVIALDASRKDWSSARASHPVTAEQEIDDIMRPDVPNSLRRLRVGILAVSAPAMAGILSDVPLPAQSAAAAPSIPTFEVASVKPNRSHPGRSRLNFLPGRFTAINIPLRTLILIAFRVQDFQVAGGPNWLDDRYFDIMATAPGNPPIDRLQSMLQTLLMDRFKLTVHHETRDLPIYALVMAKPDRRMGGQLRHSGADCAPISAPAGAPPPPPPPPTVGPPPAAGGPLDPNRVGGRCPGMLIPGRFSSRDITMEQFANVLARFLRRAVLDRTGLSGNFDVDLEYSPDQPTPNGPGGLPPAIALPSDAPSIFTALQEQLGLKLDPTKGSVDVLVIDHAEQPTEN